MPDVPTSVLRLAETLVMLAASADEQVAWVDRHRWSEDELALDFDWANGWVPWSVDERSPDLLSPVLHELLQRIDGRLAEMSGQANADKWTPEGLATDPGWTEVRHLSGQALTEIATLGLIAIPSPGDL
jgi:hypothetical protein